jgi:DNA-directed RNA polymerase subunit RPC12/RpoP
MNDEIALHSSFTVHDSQFTMLMSVTKEPLKNKVDQLACPYCQSTDNELFSLFGQTLLSSQYYCRQCHSIFEAVRWEEEEREPLAVNREQ